MHPLLNIATKAVRSASKTILRNFERLDRVKIQDKGVNDFVSEIDKKVEQEIIDIIKESYPNHSILGEESGTEHSGSDNHDEYLWIIDPIDGTANYIHGYPRFAISIGVQYKNKMLCGLIYDPLAQEIFTAENGRGAYCNNKRIRVRQQKDLYGSLLSVAFSHNTSTQKELYLKTLGATEFRSAGIRRTGSAALDLAYIASGRLDGMWAFNLKPWDVSAGTLLITEAGGMVSDFEGGNKYFTSGNIITGSPSVHKELSKIIQECSQEC